MMPAPVILRVYLSNNNLTVAEVPITPETTCRDVVDCCKEPGEVNCHLAEHWRGSERPVGDDERPFDILQQWGIHRDEVKFYLRHEGNMPTANGGEQGSRQPKKKNGVKEASPESQLPPGLDLTLADLQEMATRQQQQIESQQQMLVAKEQRLKFLKQQDKAQQEMAEENERLRMLRDKVESQEMKLRKLRSLRGQAEQQRTTNSNLSSELESVRQLFSEKQKELAAAVSRVDGLTKQLEDLRTGKVNGYNGDISHAASMAAELERLRKELMIRNRLNDQQNAKLQAQRESLNQRNNEMSYMDKRIAELTDRLRKKKAAQQQRQPNKASQNEGETKSQAGKAQNIAAVEPYIQQPKQSRDNLKPNGRAYTEPIKEMPNDGDLKQGNYLPNGGLPVMPTHFTPEKSNFTPSKGHSEAYAVMEETLKSVEGEPSQLKSPYGKGQSPKSKDYGIGLSLAPRPFVPGGSTLKSYGSDSSMSSQASGRGQPEGVNENSARSSPVVEGRAVNGQGNNHIATQNSRPNYLNVEGATVGRLSPQLERKPKEGGLYASKDRPHSSYELLDMIREQDSAAMRKNYHSSGDLPGDSQREQGLSKKTPPKTRPKPSNGHKNSSQTDGPSGKLDTSPKALDTALAILKGGNRPAVTSSGYTSYRSGPHVTRAGFTSPTTNDVMSFPSPGQQQGRTDKSVVRAGGEGSQTLRPFSSTASQGGKIESPTATVRPLPQDGQGGMEAHAPVSSQTVPYPPIQGQTGPYSPVSTVVTGPFPPASAHGGQPVRSPSPTKQGYYQQEPSPSQTGQPPDSRERPPSPRKQPPQYTGPQHPAEGSQQRPPSPRKYSSPPSSQSSPPTSQAGQSASPEYLHPDDSVQTRQKSEEFQDDSFDARRPVSPTKHLTPKPGSAYERLFPNADPEKIRRIAHAPRPLRKRHSFNEGEGPPAQQQYYRGSPPAHPATQGPPPAYPSSPKPQEQESPPSPQYSSPAPDTQQQNVSPTRETPPEQGQNVAQNNGQTSPQQQPPPSSPQQPPQQPRSPPPNQQTKPMQPEKKSNLKGRNGVKPKRNVRFDPLALLLDASLEGEFDLVQDIINQVENPSGSNDEGITALHNAICAGYHDIVTFLVEYGCDVNSQDSDGWTPLHCAASCNNMPMVELLVTSGACIFATTISDVETAAEKCEELEDGYTGCSEYLYGIQEKMGIVNGGLVYALFDYEAEESDELSFREGEPLYILRKGDADEIEWWWARSQEGKEGYVARNLLGMSPRIPQKRP
ncbi:PREDICTED: apoptosis-stimulating of p53 protein 2-like isoform X1 [Branchiostoma belcheri]|uniref:Apoptosis-stimulating of p53 protein 2-like isoform X1 n=2 Tax=Branchiostoma belcheri TaxID=7741 RepID=A0A6P4ZZN2_BRABE|nr:PREDICTED: apoptosis-stimulating of p53 protein 2-like isoform X1 [Branchiostoma belcheri]